MPGWKQKGNLNENHQRSIIEFKAACTGATNEIGNLSR
jgi:hypothetical protein